MIHYITSNGIGNAWVGNELALIGKAGIPFKLHTLRRPESLFFKSEWAKQLDRDTLEIYPIGPRLAASVLTAPFLFGGRFFAALGNALFGKRESIKHRAAAFAHFLVACDWARRIRRENISLIHSQWIHSAGTVGMYGAWLLGRPFSFTGHAADLFRDRVALEDKVRRAEFIVCISEFHREFYKSLGARDEQLHIVYCGIDLTHFAPPPPSDHDPRKPLRIRSSGRLVEKKGFTHLIDACKILKDREVAYECVIAGSGPLQAPLQQQIDRLGLSDLVRLTGKEIKQEEIPGFMHGGDLYCLPCAWSSDNDVDGLPQMIMEAMACGLPAISTRLVGIPDLVVHERTGLLVEPKNPTQLANAIQRLRDDPTLARRLADDGQRHLAEVFEIEKALQPLIRLYQQKLSCDHDLSALGTTPGGRPATKVAAPAHNAAKSVRNDRDLSLTRQG